VKKWQKASANNERRGGARGTVLLRATLTAPYGEVRVFVRNLSQGGALIDGDHPVWPGMKVTLNFAGAAIPAQVAWAEEPRFGLAFDALLSEEEVTRYLDTGPSRIEA
jgi:hypothetical protein